METGQRGQDDYETSMPNGRRLSLNALISIYIEPFSPLDQKDFSFPTGPADGHQHFTVPMIVSDPLYQSPDKGNYHLASSPPDYPPSVQQMQSSLTDGLPQREDLQLSCSGLPHHPTHLSSGRHGDSLSKFYLQSGDRLPLEGNSLIAPGSLEFCDRATEAYSHNAGCLSESNGNSLTWSQNPNSLTSTERLQCSFRLDLPQREGPELLCSGLDDDPSLSYSRLARNDKPHDTRLPEDNYTLDSGLLDRGTVVHSQNASCGSVSSNYNSQHLFLPYLRGQGNPTGLLPYSRETEMCSGGHNDVLVVSLPIVGGEFGESASTGCAPAEEILIDLDGASAESAFVYHSFSTSLLRWVSDGTEGTDGSTGRGGSGCMEQSLTRRHPLQRMRTPTGSRDRGPKSWEFLMNLLADSRYNPSLIEWDDEQRFIFRLVKPCEVAEMWASRKGQNNGVDKNNFARNLRYFYKDGTLQAVKEKQYVYRCGTKAIQFYKNLLFSERGI